MIELFLILHNLHLDSRSKNILSTHVDFSSNVDEFIFKLSI